MILTQAMRAYQAVRSLPEPGPDEVPSEFPQRDHSPGPDDVDDRRYDDHYTPGFADPDGSGSYAGI